MTVSENVPAVFDHEDAEIHALLVDDYDQWVSFMAREMERQNPDLRVRTALSANEAIQELSNDDGIECVVSDYRMPEVDGLELLRRVRDERPDLPFILVTGEGNERVAVEAISAGVTDYIVKDPSSEQTSVFATRIKRAVSEYRLRRAIEESEKRYRTVMEQVAEGIVILRDGDLVYQNERLGELTGYAAETLEDAGFFEAVHPDDRAAVRRHCEEIAGGRSSDEQAEARIRRPDGQTRHCICSGQSIVYDGEPAVLLSIRDVTNRRQRERRLEWERDINRQLLTILVESRDREALEARVCDLLVDFGYALAWIGISGNDRLSPRASAGTSAVLDGFDHFVDEAQDDVPSVWAARSRSPKFVDDIGELFPTGWRDRAIEYGLQSGGALPLEYNDVFYGTLAVYRDDDGGIDAIERELLGDLANTLAFAIHTIETAQALASGALIRVTVTLSGSTYYLNDLTERPPFRGTESRVTVHGTLPREGDGTIQYVSVEGVSTEDFVEGTADHPAVRSARRISDGHDRIQVTVSGTTPESRLAALGARVVRTTVESGRATVSFELPRTRDIRSTLDTLEDSVGTVTVESIVETERGDGDSEGPIGTWPVDLTEKQENALRAAYHHGYFEQPRVNSATEVAVALGVSHSTFLQHLRVAQRKVFGTVFD